MTLTDDQLASMVDAPLHLLSAGGPGGLQEAGPEGPTPRQIVEALDAYIVGQAPAKRAVAVALRNRFRRRRVSGPLQREITPKNILMIGPTGVGKTEIARRLAQLAGAPFVKVDATKFTEVGYVGRDVDAMVRELMDEAVRMVRAELEASQQTRAEEAVTEKLLDLLHPYPRRARYDLLDRPGPVPSEESLFKGGEIPSGHSEADLYPADARIRERLAQELASGRLEDERIELTIEEAESTPLPFLPGDMEVNLGLQEMVNTMLPRKRRRKRMTVAEARRRLMQEELAKAVDLEQVVALAKERAEESGIIFIDEIDKVTSRGGGGQGPEVSREGVQRDLLPLIEGSQVQTKYGPVSTDHVLFIAAGAFHLSRPSDLIPELQGRFPVRVELTSLTAADFARILTEPDNALTRQYQALLAADGVELTFTPEGVQALAELA
ncbi:MAG TPA: ATP-dependent protease ATPase subunit HslU, partial [bacterium]|nr:ATP-dependent protease ATPase subunit HslU [bacterium]